MVNAWSLLDSVLNGTLDEDYPIMNKMNDDDVIVLGGSASSVSGGSSQDSISFDQSWWEEDGISITGNPMASSDSISFGSSSLFGGADSVSLDTGNDSVSFIGSGVLGGEGEDSLSFDYGGYAGYDPYPTLGSLEYNRKPQPNLKDGSNQKYQENKGIAALKDYVASTYSGHYTNNNSDVQTLDLIHSVGDAESFCRSNAIKYLSRYDKKGQAKRDILKAMHYCLLLYYFSGNTNDETPTRGYETF